MLLQDLFLLKRNRWWGEDLPEIQFYILLEYEQLLKESFLLLGLLGDLID